MIFGDEQLWGANSNQILDITADQIRWFFTVLFQIDHEVVCSISEKQSTDELIDHLWLRKNLLQYVFTPILGNLHFTEHEGPAE